MRPTAVCGLLNVASSAGAPPPVEEDQLLKPNDVKEARAQHYKVKRMELIEQMRATELSSQIIPLIGQEISDISEDLREFCATKLFVKLTAPGN